MLILLASIVALLAGYFVYGRIVDSIFRSDPDRPTPANRKADGVDFVKMPSWKLFLVQLLNIAGLGPVFGPILGALYGPSALLWIVLGTIFAGAVHDFFSGMLSIRNDGMSVPDIVGCELGNTAKQFMRFFSIILLVLVGVVFVLGPAKLLSSLLGIKTDYWIVLIFIYFFIATILPIDKIIGRFYPFFGAVLIFMAVSLPVALIVRGYRLFPQVTLENLHPQDLPLWPLMFITIACGAISGFHSTQSPMIARCVNNEREGRRVFYGAMICEGLIALIWATLGMSFFGSVNALHEALTPDGPAAVVNKISTTLLGHFGGVLAVLGVVVLPITTGDTAFRAARLIIADATRLSQKRVQPRLYIALPLFAIGIIVSRTPFDVLWRYFGWANQTLAAIVLWSIATWLARNRRFHWIATLPAAFMTVIVISYLCYEKIGFNMPMGKSTIIGLVTAFLLLIIFLVKKNKYTPV